MRYILLALTVVLLCAGCSDTTMTQDSRISSFPESEYAKIAPKQEDGTLLAPTALLTKDDQLILALYGSSSCPPIPMQFSVEPEAVHITLKDYTDVMCTADFGGPHLYAIDLSDNLPRNSKEFNVTFDNLDSPIPVVILE